MKDTLEFLPYTESEELKNLGYNFSSIVRRANIPFNNSDVSYFKPILIQQAFRWFRENYNLIPEISYGGLKGKYQVFVNNYIYDVDNVHPKLFSYNDAEIAAIQEMIKIIKNGHK